MRNISSTLVIAFLLSGTLTSAQSAEKRTILVNGVATEVMLNGSGDIESTVRTRPNYMQGYVKAPANLNRAPASNPTMEEVATIPNTAAGDLMVSFAKNKFVLDSNGTENLAKVLDQLKTAEKGFVLLRSKFQASSSSSNVVAQKRVYACKKYLESKGIAPNKILISLEPGDMDSNDVKVFVR